MEEQYKDLKNLIQEAGLENPSSGFLHNVMDRVEASVQKPLEQYKPLISSKGWVVIGFVIVTLISLLLLFESNEKSFFDNIDFLEFPLSFSDNLFSGYTFHKTTIYGILFLCVLFFVQVPMLKRKIDKDFS